MLGFPSRQGGNWERELQYIFTQQANFVKKKALAGKNQALQAHLTCKDVTRIEDPHENQQRLISKYLIIIHRSGGE